MIQLVSYKGAVKTATSPDIYQVPTGNKLVIKSLYVTNRYSTPLQLMMTMGIRVFGGIWFKGDSHYQWNNLEIVLEAGEFVSAYTNTGVSPDNLNIFYSAMLISSDDPEYDKYTKYYSGSVPSTTPATIILPAVNYTRIIKSIFITNKTQNPGDVELLLDEKYIMPKLKFTEPYDTLLVPDLNLTLAPGKTLKAQGNSSTFEMRISGRLNP